VKNECIVSKINECFVVVYIVVINGLLVYRIW